MAKDGSDQDTFGHWITRHLNASDIDSQEHVYNGTFTMLCADARTAFLESTVRNLVSPHDLLMIARVEMDFLRPMALGPEVRIGTRIASIRHSSLRLDHTMVQAGLVSARSSAVVVRFDAGKGKSYAWPQEVRALLGTVLEGGE